MLNKYGQLDARNFDTYEASFGPAEEDFPPRSGRPRRPIRPAGRIATLEAGVQPLPDMVDVVENPNIEPVTEFRDSPEGYSSFEVETLGDVATASIAPINTKTI